MKWEDMDTELQESLWAAEAPELMSLDYPWPDELPDDEIFGKFTELKEAFGSPRDKIIRRAGVVLEAFEKIEMKSPDAGKELNNALMPLGSNAWSQFILAYIDDISTDAMRYVMPWAHAGWNMGIGGPRINYDEWTDVWRDIQYLTDDKPKPTKPIVVYTGNRIDRGPWIDWTTDREVAVWFANMVPDGTPVGVWKTLAHPSVIMGRLDDRGESEVLIDIDLVEVELDEQWEPHVETDLS